MLICRTFRILTNTSAWSSNASDSSIVPPPSPQTPSLISFVNLWWIRQLKAAAISWQPWTFPLPELPEDFCLPFGTFHVKTKAPLRFCSEAHPAAPPPQPGWILGHATEFDERGFAEAYREDVEHFQVFKRTWILLAVERTN